MPKTESNYANNSEGHKGPPPNTIMPNNNEKGSDHKRRRVTRACDNCRQKKVKCDGKQPCIHCTVYSYNCTYDQPNIRNKKNSGIPVPSGANVISQSGTPGGPNTTVAQSLVETLFPGLKARLSDDKNGIDFEKLQRIVNYVKASGNNTFNEIQDMYNEVESPNYAGTFRPHSSCSNEDSGAIGREIRINLPSKDIALKLIFTTWNKACVLFRFYHRPSLLEEVDLLYSMDPLSYTDRQQKFLPFFYSILACGSLFSKDTAMDSKNEVLEDEGFKYFLEARKLIDISNVGDINSIQTIVMMIMYLQCSARLSTCYSYIGIALRSAVKEGLHRDLSIFQNSKRKLDPIEIDTRKRLFYTIFKMNIYINSLLGLPLSIQEDEIDQELPEDLDDENITRSEFLFEQQGNRLSSSGCANHHTKLMLILSHIVRDLYPVKVKSNEEPTPENMHSRVTHLELELKKWLDELPPELQPTNTNDANIQSIPEKFLLANFYLHLAFLNCQIMLYRPFIHFISNGSLYQNSDPRSLIRGRNCIKVARIVVKLANKMIDQNLLVGTYWFSMYTIFFSVACLIYYFHFANYNNDSLSGVNYAGVLFDDDLNIDMIKKDIEIGKKVLDCLKNNSNASLRIYNILNTLFEQLNRRTAKTSGSSMETIGNINSAQLQTESIQSTFQNFDKINSYQTSGPYSVYGEKAFDQMSPLYDLNNIKYNNSEETTNSVTNSVAPIDNGPTTMSNASSTQNPPQQNENPVDNSGSPKRDLYLPGMFDKLDAQIFGRILPPYMLEKNAKQSSEAVSQVKDTDKNDLIDINNIEIPSMQESNSLEYLDPFNPVNTDSNFNFSF